MGEEPLPCWPKQSRGGSHLLGLEHSQRPGTELGTEGQKNQVEGGRAAKQKAENQGLGKWGWVKPHEYSHLKPDEKWGSSWREMLAGKQDKTAGWRTKKH